MSVSERRRINATAPAAPTPLATRMVVSAIGGMGAATCCHPIDVVRIQMQLYKFEGTVDAARSIVRQGGVGGLYNGITAAYLRQWTYGSCRLGLCWLRCGGRWRTSRIS